MTTQFIDPSSPQNDVLTLKTDVLVIGGGLSGTWVAWGAASQGAKVILVDKGYCGTSGSSAPAGNGVWYVQPDSELREQAMASREALGGFLANRQWMERVLDQTFENINLVAEWGYPFPIDENGVSQRQSIQGPEYMRLMRKKIRRAGVEILDHSPALELLVDAEGRVAGASGIQRQTGEQWIVKAGAVVIATGGCAFLSKALGCNVLTGDGYLMAAEAGAEFSGMEFSNAYGLSPAFSSVTKGRFYSWANFYYEDGTPIEGAGSHRGRGIIAKTLMSQPVYARLDQEGITEEVKAWMRRAQPNFFLPFNRMGIDPFTQLFPVTLRLEGTVRGTGGLRIVDSTCATSVPGLYASGDAATRELICGGFTGGGSHNAAWAISSGRWAGEAAADYAQSLGDRAHQRSLQGLGQAGLRGESKQSVSPDEVVAATQAEVFPYDRNFFRTASVLSDSLGRLDTLWKEIRNSAPATSNLLRSREAASMVATARWMYNSGLHRTESRGMHKRSDYPEQDPKQHHYVISGGLDHVWVKSAAIEQPAANVEKELVLQ
ncbi:FAD-dependent oxidoreductase [Alkalinema pantanalense CENA528]|uniref:FAD-dependent oxidoreductase n=1 Tax=Alkalinema pantanalense TaxID=1620705 RepID=UPI003D6E910C